MSTRKRWTDQQWGVGAVVVAAIAFAVLVIIASTAAASSTVIIDVPSATRLGDDQMSFTGATNAEGQTCDVWLQETNEPQPSAHPGNTLTLSSGGHLVAVMDIERSRGGSNSEQILGVVVGPTMTLEWVNGPDGVSSAGASVSIDCEQETPSTTSPPSLPSTTSVPSSTTLPALEPSTTTSSSTVPESSSTTTAVVTTSTSSSFNPPETTTAAGSSSTVPVIPSGVPTGSSGPARLIWPGVLAATLIVVLSGAAIWRLHHDG